MKQHIVILLLSAMTSVCFAETGEQSIRNFVSGYTLEWTDTNTITIKEGKCADSTASLFITSSGDIFCDLSVSGTNGLDSGTETNDFFYHLYICTDDGETIYAMFSTNSSSPAGATFYRRLGCVLNDSNSDIPEFRYVGDDNYREIRLDGPATLLAAGTAASFVDLDCSAFMPPTSTYAYFALIIIGAGGTSQLSIRPNGSSSTWTSRCRASNQGSDLVYDFTDSNQIIEYEISAGSAYVYLIGYVEII